MAVHARRDRHREPLTRELVVDKALARADAGGLEAVSFRRLAADLGVTPMALYRYVGSKNELMAAIGDRVFSAFELPGPEITDWRERLRALARSYRRVLLAHPAVATLSGSQAPERAKPIMEVLLAALRMAGFRIEEAAVLEGNLERFVLALVLLEIGDGRSEDEQAAEARVRAQRAHLLTLPPERFPHVIEAADYLCDRTDPEWAFEFALDLLIGGLEKLLETSTRA